RWGRGGNSPPLQVIASEVQASHDLSGSGLHAGGRVAWYCAAVEPIHISKAARQPLLSISGGRRDRVAARQQCKAAGLYRNWTRKEKAVKHVIELRADLKLDVALAVDGKNSAEAA